jgi:hypothetical protein
MVGNAMAVLTLAKVLCIKAAQPTASVHPKVCFPNDGKSEMWEMHVPLSFLFDQHSQE